MNTHHDIVVLLAKDWSGFGRRHLFTSMAKANADCRILCVQRPICFLTAPFLNRRKALSWFRKEQRVMKLLPNLFIYQPVVALHDHLAQYVPWADELNNKMLSYQVLKKVDGLGLRKNNLVLWVSDPIQESCIGIVDEKKRVYDCFDDYFAVPGNRITKNIEKHRLRERRILENVDIVLTVSDELRREKAMINKNTHLVPNAADTDLFQRASDRSIAVHPDLKAVPRPVIGMVGNLNQRIDFRLVRDTAVNHPEWSIVIVGGWSGADPALVDSDLIKEMKKIHNIHWMGHRPMDALPDLMRAFDVCIIPYLPEDPFNVSCSPLKLYEYMATGKPIVSTRLPAIDEYSDVVHIADDLRGFEQGIRLGLTEKNGSGARRIKLAHKNSWDNRADEISSIMKGSETYRTH